jgi:hypothetical protein
MAVVVSWYPCERRSNHGHPVGELSEVRPQVASGSDGVGTPSDAFQQSQTTARTAIDLYSETERSPQRRESGRLILFGWSGDGERVRIDRSVRSQDS